MIKNICFLVDKPPTYASTVPPTSKGELCRSLKYSHYLWPLISQWAVCLSINAKGHFAHNRGVTGQQYITARDENV